MSRHYSLSLSHSQIIIKKKKNRKTTTVRLFNYLKTSITSRCAAGINFRHKNAFICCVDRISLLAVQSALNVHAKSFAIIFHNYDVLHTSSSSSNSRFFPCSHTQTQTHFTRQMMRYTRRKREREKKIKTTKN